MALKIINNIAAIQETYELANNISVFATQDYADYLINTTNVKTFWFIEEVDNSIAYLIPFAIKKKLIFNVGFFLTAVNNFNNNNIEGEKQFLEEVVSLLKKNKLCDWIQQPPNWALFKTVPLNSIYCEFGTFKIDLQECNETELYNKLKNNSKYEIRKAIKNNIVIKKGIECLEDCIKIFNNAEMNNNFKYPTKKEIEMLLDYIKDNIEFYVSYWNDTPQSCNIVFFNKFSHYGLYSATISKPLHGANYLLFWELIRDMKLRGVKYFDFVGARINPRPGSKQEKIQLFKKHFGGELVTGYLWKLPISKTKYYFYNLLVKIVFTIKQKKIKGDIIDQERERSII